MLIICTRRFRLALRRLPVLQTPGAATVALGFGYSLRLWKEVGCELCGARITQDAAEQHRTARTMLLPIPVPNPAEIILFSCTVMIRNTVLQYICLNDHLPPILLRSILEAAGDFALHSSLLAASSQSASCNPAHCPSNNLSSRRHDIFFAPLFTPRIAR